MASRYRIRFEPKKFSGTPNIENCHADDTECSVNSSLNLSRHGSTRSIIRFFEQTGPKLDTSLETDEFSFRIVPRHLDSKRPRVRRVNLRNSQFSIGNRLHGRKNTHSIRVPLKQMVDQDTLSDEEGSNYESNRISTEPRTFTLVAHDWDAGSQDEFEKSITVFDTGELAHRAHDHDTDDDEDIDHCSIIKNWQLEEETNHNDSIEGQDVESTTGEGDHEEHSLDDGDDESNMSMECELMTDDLEKEPNICYAAYMDKFDISKKVENRLVTLNVYTEYDEEEQQEMAGKGSTTNLYMPKIRKFKGTIDEDRLLAPQYGTTLIKPIRIVKKRMLPTFDQVKEGCITF